MSTPEIRRAYRDDELMWSGIHSSNGGNVVDDGKALQKELPICHDDGFIDMVDSLIVVIRWPLLCFAVVAMVLFIVAMVLHLPWAK